MGGASQNGAVSRIVDSSGKPLSNGKAHGRQSAKLKAFVDSMNQWFQSLSSTRMPALIKAEDPLSHHAWVFAAAMTIATTAAQAPLMVFRETEDQLERRRQAELRAKRSWRGPRAGAGRRALARHQRSRSVVRRKTLEPDLNHPLIDLLRAPNPLQMGDQLIQMTILWLVVRGEVHWLLTDPDGRPVDALSFPDQVWPMSPDLMTPIYERGDRGTLVGWELSVPRWMPSGVAGFAKVRYPLTSVVQMKLPNIKDLVRGFSRLTSVASSIETDLLAKAFTRSLLEKGAIPGGMLEFQGNLKDKEEEAIREKFKERHAGPENGGRLLILQGGLKYNSVAHSPAEMQFKDHMEFDRDEVLAVLGTPPTVVGLRDVANYATAQVWDLGFWEKTILPIFSAIETAIDAALMDRETDDVFAMFDTTGVDAFRSGLSDKLAMAEKLAGDRLHAPPRVAFETVGLEIAEYEGDDKALVSAVLVPVETSLEPPEPAPAAAPGDVEEDDAADDGGDPSPAPPPPGAAARKGAKNQARWRAFVKVQQALEGRMKSAWRQWVAEEKADALKRLDAEAKRVGAKGWSARVKADGVTVGAILPAEKDSTRRLKNKARPVMGSTVEQTYDLTLDDLGGVPVFEIDDERIMKALDVREKKLLQSAPTTLRKNLRRSLEEGLAAGETIQQLRVRIGEVFNIAGSSAKTLQVARTETAGLMNAVRDAMFEAQGFKKAEWVTAGDENVRDSHIEYGRAGAQDRGFDYLTLLEDDKPGSLKFPGDPEAPPDETINCRCVMIPAV